MSGEALLLPWSSFYIVTGSAAAALIGLMFVVITIVMGTERVRKSPTGISAFSTPTVVHFGAALVFSALLIVPWPRLVFPAVIIGIAAAYEIFYLLRITWISQHLSGYRPDAEDLAWYTVMPLVAYGAICAGSIGLLLRPRVALFALAAGVLMLVFIGIRNAWDVVTYLAIGETPEE